MPSDTTLLTILHTNDLHARIEQLPLISAMVKRIRREVADQGGHTLLWDGGDAEDRILLESDVTKGAAIMAMMNAMGYFSEELSKEEKSFFLGSLEDYKAGRLPFSVNTTILKSWIIRFQQDYLMKQSFFEPYPEELRDIDATITYCDGKDYWP